MNDYSIKDLDLAGVRWEIADVPLALRAKWNQESKNTSEPAVNTDNDATRVMVVPPIAPVATVSVDTAVSMAARPTDIDNLIRIMSK